MNKCIVFEDGILQENLSEDCKVLWDGLFSRVLKDGFLIHFLQSCLPKNTLFVVPLSDGNMKSSHTEDEYKGHPNMALWEDIEPYINEAREKNKVFMLGTLSQITEEPGVNYIYLPLDDDFLQHGVRYFFPNIPEWCERSSDLCWRGGCYGVNPTIRARFVEKLFEYNKVDTRNVRLSRWWCEDKNINEKYFADPLCDRLHFSEFFKYKIFFIVDGNVISSSHMWGFASGAVPFLISNAKCWFSSFAVPFVHYIPIEYDLSNLIEQIEWVLENDEKASQIAQNALDFSREYFSAEFQQNYLHDSIKCCSEKVILNHSMGYR